MTRPQPSTRMKSRILNGSEIITGGSIIMPIDISAADTTRSMTRNGMKITKPMMNNEITPEQAFERATEPFRVFMLKNVREKDLQLFNNMAREPAPASPEQVSLRILVPAFMISELKRAFEIGFLLFLPFLIIDLVIASILMSMGMMMLPPIVVSLPFKLIFFVLVDGWSLVAGSLVQSYGL